MSAQGALSHWRFDEGSGSEVIDSAETANGTLTSEGQWSIDSKVGDNAINATGNDPAVNVNDPGVVGTNDRTIAVWLKGQLGEEGSSDRQAWYHTGADSGSASGNRWILTWENPGIGLHVANGNKFWDISGENIDLNQYNHVVVRLEGDHTSDTDAFINGNKVPVDSSNGQSIDTDSTDQDIASSFEGNLDELVVWDRALSDSEIQDWYNATR